jgi:replicative DNA helicase
MDLDILAVMGLRENYDKYSRFVKPSSLSDESWNIFSALGEWFGSNKTAGNIDWGSFGAWLSLVRFAKYDKAKLATIKGIVVMLETHEPNEESVETLLHGLAKRDYASQIADYTLRIADGDYDKDFDEIDTLIHAYRQLTGSIDSLDGKTGSFSLDELQSVTDPGLEWRLKCLRESCGDVRKADLIVFGKRPDTGGTTFMASEVTYMAEQLDDDLDVIWFNNEEGGSKVRRRLVQAATGFHSDRMNTDLEAALKEYDARMGRRDRIKVVDNAKIHYKDVERYLKKSRPGIIVFDQLWKMHGFGDLSADQQTKIFNWARELCKEYAPVMAVHQAGVEADNIKWIEQGMLYYGKTGPQGEADAIITMGRLTDRGNTRYLYVPKNKLQTPGNPTMRNGRYEVEIDAQHARFKEP